MSFDVQNKNQLWEDAYIKEHLHSKLPHPIKSIFSIQRNGQRKVTFVSINGDNNIIMKGLLVISILTDVITDRYTIDFEPLKKPILSKT